MPKRRKYNFYLCKDCEIDFLVNKVSRNTFCPNCGENIYTEFKTSIWIEKPLLHEKRWTLEEDEILIAGKTNGYKTKEIAEDLDRTPWAIDHRWHRMKHEWGLVKK